MPRFSFTQSYPSPLGIFCKIVLVNLPFIKCSYSWLSFILYPFLWLEIFNKKYFQGHTWVFDNVTNVWFLFHVFLFIFWQGRSFQEEKYRILKILEQKRNWHERKSICPNYWRAFKLNLMKNEISNITF